jgi:aryl-alcohol dehydrogenase-like predicted oxidoreductase
MLYSKLGRTGLIVSKLTLGTMTFTSGGGNAAIAKTDLSQSDQIVGTAIDAGINFFDTADVYSEGQSEEILGKVLGARRHDVIIATKAGWRMGEPLNRTGLSASHLHWSIDQSLKRLGTDYVDVYIAHRNDLHTPLEETLIALDAIVKSGKARYLGVSNWPAWKVAAAIELQRANGWAPFTHAQMMYSLLGRGIEGEIMPMLQNYGLGLTAWSPLAGGFLSGKYTRESLKDSTNRLSGFDMIPFDKEHGFALITTLRDIAAAHDATVAQVALAWVLGRSSVSSALIGASRISQLEDNLGAVNVLLTDEDRARLEIETAPDLDFSIGVTQVPDGPITKALANSSSTLSNERANPAS